MTTAFLNSAGTVAEDNEKFMIFTMVGRRESRHSLRRNVGMGSKEHDLEAEDRMSFFTSSEVAGEKLLRGLTYRIPDPYI